MSNVNIETLRNISQLFPDVAYDTILSYDAYDANTNATFIMIIIIQWYFS